MNKGFFQRVYDIVEKIPSGKVITYGQIAMLLGEPRSARVVGFAMGAAPTGRGLPCHRVVAKSGKLSPPGIFSGTHTQRELLEMEGVTFLPDGRINMDKHLWI